MPHDVLIQRLAGDPLHEAPEHVGADVAVHHPDARHGIERCREHELGEAVRIVCLPVVRLECRQAGRVSDQMPYGHPILVGTTPLRDISLQGCVEIDLALLVKLHDG